MRLVSLILIAITACANEDRYAAEEEKAKVVEILMQYNCPAVGDVDYTQGTGFKAEDLKCNDGNGYDVVIDGNFAITSNGENAD